MLLFHNGNRHTHKMGQVILIYVAHTVIRFEPPGLVHQGKAPAMTGWGFCLNRLTALSGRTDTLSEEPKTKARHVPDL